MLLTSKQVADRLHVSSATVNHWAKIGKLKGTNVGKGNKKSFWRFNSKDIITYEKENGKSKKVVNNPVGIMSSLITRLDKLESKIDHLIKIWS